jgi:hypothetical protein
MTRFPPSQGRKTNHEEEDMQKKKSEENKLETWREAWMRPCTWCKATEETPCRDSAGIALSREASGLPTHHLNR